MKTLKVKKLFLVQAKNSRIYLQYKRTSLEELCPEILNTKSTEKVQGEK